MQTQFKEIFFRPFISGIQPTKCLEGSIPRGILDGIPPENTTVYLNIPNLGSESFYENSLNVRLQSAPMNSFFEQLRKTSTNLFDLLKSSLLARQWLRGDCHGMEMLLRYVTYPEDGLWVAHCLELDIIGVGETQDSAIKELKENSNAHLSFAKFKNISPLRSAPKHVQKLWEVTNMAALQVPAPGERATKKPQSRLTDAPKTRSKASVMKWSARQISQLPRFEHCS